MTTALLHTAVAAYTCDRNRAECWFRVARLSHSGIAFELGEGTSTSAFARYSYPYLSSFFLMESEE